jgi:D-tyrosyl-tRNA(Tyr) deacylase
MKVVIQRVLEASVTIDGEVVAAIGQGLMVLVGFEPSDEAEDSAWMSKKIVNLRIFDDEEGIMNRSIKDAEGEILVVSQFTLHARTKKGNRPSYVDAAPPDVSIPLYNEFVELLSAELGCRVKTGIFGANMKVKLINDGPVTILMDTKNKL